MRARWRSPPGQFGHESAGQIVEAGGLQGGGHGFAVGCLVPVGVSAHGDHLRNSEVKVEVELLGDHAHPPRQFHRPVALQRAAFERQFPARQAHASGKGSEQRRLSRTVGPEHPEEGAGGDVEVHGAEDVFAPQFHFETAGDIDGGRFLAHVLTHPCARGAGKGRRDRRPRP